MPSGLAAYGQEGAVIGFPLRSDNAAVIRVGYRFRCRVREFCRSSPDGAEACVTAPSAACLRPSYPRWVMDELRNLPPLRRLPSSATPSRRARQIYAWMLENLQFCCVPGPDYLAVATGRGTCIELTRLFVNLCRLSGVPARERWGALFGFANPDDTASSDDAVTPFGHTWAEFFHSPRGWIPVETIPVGHGSREVTAHNFPDEALRAQFSSETPLYDDYFFGNLDPFRIHGSRYALDLPAVAIQRDGRWAALPPDLRLVNRLSARWQVSQPS
jgi:hypothetical protein